MAIKLTSDEIEAMRSERGGFTKATLAHWGVPWPPPKGWKEALMAGVEFDTMGQLETSPIRSDVSAHDLLRTVVLAVIEKGHASDLYEFPDVLAHFGAQMPVDECKHVFRHELLPKGGQRSTCTLCGVFEERY